MTDGTKALQNFKWNIRRSRALLDMFDAESPKKEKNRVGKSSWQGRELLRASIIVTIGALDAYLSDVTAEVLVSQLESGRIVSEPGRAALKRISKDMDTLALELALVTKQSTRKQVAIEKINHFFDTQVSNHGSKGVAAAVSRMGEIMDWTALDSKIPQHAHRSLTKSGGAASVLDEWTTNRHQLVHQGRALKIKSVEARAAADFVELIVGHADAIALKAGASAV
jgi:hypothetical protein